MHTLTHSIFQTFTGTPLRPRLRWLHAAVIALLLAVSQLVPVAGVAHAQDAASAGNAVNINTADAATLADRLSGVGLTRAQEIVRYRESYGPFSTVEELADVKGIGPATVEKNRARIVLE